MKWFFLPDSASAGVASNLNPMLALTITATVHIGVFGSFHPKVLELRPAAGTVLHVQDRGQSKILQGMETLKITGPLYVSGGNGEPVRFSLAVPGVVRREYAGRLTVKKRGVELIPIVEMSRETAVTSILAGEGADALPLEARKAQAIAARSYLAAVHGRHEGFDFCDTTHCQKLNGASAAASVAARAVRDTREVVLMYRGTIVPALYTANCGGRTKTPIDAGWMVAGYPYFPVACPLKGDGAGHGIGLCQLGAQSMAQRGATFDQILSHFFPHTTLESVTQQVPVLISDTGVHAAW
ncbi:MAG: SpoIID/LytB domain-containing protein [Bryobacteraceae bacterium]